MYRRLEKKIRKIMQMQCNLSWIVWKRLKSLLRATSEKSLERQSKKKLKICVISDLRFNNLWLNSSGLFMPYVPIFFASCHYEESNQDMSVCHDYNRSKQFGLFTWLSCQNLETLICFINVHWTMEKVKNTELIVFSFSYFL